MKRQYPVINKLSHSNARVRRLLEKACSRAMRHRLPLLHCEPLESRTLLTVSATTLAGPLFVPGTTWTYLFSTPSNDTAIETIRVIGPTTLGGIPVTEVDTALGKLTSQLFYGKDPAGDIVLYGQNSESSFGESDDTYSPDQLFIPASMTLGVTYGSSDTDTTTVPAPGGGSPSVSTASDDVVESLLVENGSVSVPYNNYVNNADEVSQTITSSMMNPDGSVSTSSTNTTVWAVAGVGLVKSTDAGTGNTIELTNLTAGEYLAYSHQPTDTAAGDNIPSVTVSVKKPDGTVDTTATGSITLSLGTVTGNGSLSGTVKEPIVNGVATFNDLTVDAGGTYTLAAVDDSTTPVAPATSSQFKITAAALIWTGGGDGKNWSDPKNWDQNVAPVNGDSLTFPAGSPLAPNNDLAGLSIKNIDISGSGYTLTGNAISLTGGLTSEAGNNTYNIDTKLVGSPKLDDKTGDLTIASILSGGGLTLAGEGTYTFDQIDTYGGDTTIEAGATIDPMIADGAFGTGTVTLDAGSKPITIVAQEDTPLTIDNAIVFQDGSTLATDPKVSLTGLVKINGTDTISPINVTDNTVIAATAVISGIGSIAISGQGVLDFQADLPSSVGIQVYSGTLNLGGNLQAAVGAASQVTQFGGLTTLDASLHGTGGIDVQRGKLSSAVSLQNYSGTITLESSFGLPMFLVVAAKAYVLGTGKILVNPTDSTTPENYPTIDATAAGSTVSLINPIDLQSGSGLTVTGAVNLLGAVTLEGNASLGSLMTTAQIALNGNITGPATLALQGPGPYSFFGEVPAGVVIDATYKAKANGPSSTQLILGGTFDAPTAGAAQILADCSVQLKPGFNGTGGIDMQGGSLESGGAPKYTGEITLETNYFDTVLTYSPTITLTSGSFPLGTGLIDIAGPRDKFNGSSVSLGSARLFAPTIDATGVTGGVSLPNSLLFEDASNLLVDHRGQVDVKGSIAFTDVVQLAGDGTIFALKDSSLTFTNGIKDKGSLTLYTDSDSTISVAKNIEPTSLLYVSGAGLVKFSGNLQAPLGTNQITTLGASTLQLTTGMQGTGGIDAGATLTTTTTLNYTGNITLEDKSKVILSDGASVLGTGNITVAQNAVTTFDASAVPQGATVNNMLSLNGDGGTLGLNGCEVVGLGTVTFADAVTLNGPAYLSPKNETDQMILKAGATGDGNIYVIGQGMTTINGDIDNGVKLIAAGLDGGYLPTNGTLLLGGNLLAPPSETQQVSVEGGTLQLLSTLKGLGGIDVREGQLTTAGAPSYEGTVTIEQQTPALVTGVSVSSVAGANIFIKGSSFPLGTGPLIFAGPVTDGFNRTVNTPTLDATAVSSIVTLFNEAKFQSGANVNVVGSLKFNDVAQISGTVSLTTLTSTDQLTLNGNMSGPGNLTLDGPAPVTLNGTINLGLAINEAATMTGLFDIGANLQGSPSQITILGGKAELLNTTSGTGGINIQGGLLTTDQSNPSQGATNYNGPIQLAADSTIKIYDTSDSAGLGFGKLNLHFGLLQNASGGAASIGNAISIDGDVSTSSHGYPLKLLNSLNLTGSLTIAGSLTLKGTLTGSGSIDLNGDQFNVFGSNPTFAGTVTVEHGTVLVGPDDIPLGTGPIVANLLKQGVLDTSSTLDPSLGNPLSVTSGTLFLQGPLTFPNGISVSKGATLQIQGTGTQIVISGPLTGGGNIVVVPTATLSVTGSKSGFTGNISQGTKNLPTLVVSDAGGVANGSPFPATVTLTGIAGAAATLDGVAPTLAYYVGSTATGISSATAPSGAGTYTVVASFAGSANYAAVQSDPVIFNITSPKTDTGPTITGSPKNQNVTVGTTATFTAAASGSPTPTVQWQVSTNGGATFTDIAGATTTTLSFTATLNQNGNEYRAVFTSGKNTATTTAATLAVSSANPFSTVLIDAGGPAVGNYIADSDFNGGNIYSTTAVVDTSNAASPAPESVYQTERYGDMTYTIPGLTPNASYNVRLHFAEIFFNAAGQRSFNVSINGRQVLNNFDIFAAAGGMNKAIVKAFASNADANGKIVIAFSSVKNFAKIDGIEIVDSTVIPPPAPSTATQIDAGGAAFGTYSADQGFTGGNTYAVSHAIDTTGVADPAPQQVYQTERYGDFTYTLGRLTPGSTHTVTLSFSENYWSKAGQRVFNVTINGVQVLTNFDIFTAAGGQFKAVARTFDATANSAGKVSIVFSSVTDLAKVSAISIDTGSAPAPSSATAINAGGPAINNFDADEDFTGGNTYSNAVPVDNTTIANPPPAAVFQTERYGNFNYVIPNLTAGASYSIRLDFAELFDNAIGQRLFNVGINGTQVLTNYDIYKSAGGKFKAVAPTFTTTADSNGKVTLLFTTVKDNAKVDGIEITPVAQT